MVLYRVNRVNGVNGFQDIVVEQWDVIPVPHRELHLPGVLPDGGHDRCCGQ